MKRIIFLFLAGSCGLLRAQTNSLLQESSEREVGLHSDHFFYDGKARELVYYDNVVGTNAQGQMTCGRLTILLPPEGSASGHPTNVVAETNVVIDFLNNDGTNHITSDKAIYAYSVVNAITNETITFTGHAKGENAKGWMTGEPLVWDNITQTFYGTDFKTVAKVAPGSGVNPFATATTPHSHSATNASGADTNFPPGKLDLIPPGHPGSSLMQPVTPQPHNR
jgi:lipopolysaccharide export system protein LptA